MKTPDEIMNGQAERLDHLESDTYEEIYIKEECLGSAAGGKDPHEHVSESDDGIYNWSVGNLDTRVGGRGGLGLNFALRWFFSWPAVKKKEKNGMNMFYWMDSAERKDSAPRGFVCGVFFGGGLHCVSF